MNKHFTVSIFAVLLLVGMNGFAEETTRKNGGESIMDKKISLGAEISLLTPVWVIGSYDKANKPNMMTAAWVGICCSQPPCVTVSLRKATYTYHNIMAKKAFTVNIPSRNYIKATDYFGMVSGKDVDKLAATGLTPVKGDHVDAPYIKEFPVAVECKLVNTLELGLHTMFIGEIIDVKADKALGDNKEALLNMLIFNPKQRNYYGLGENLGRAFSIGKEIRSKGQPEK